MDSVRVTGRRRLLVLALLAASVVLLPGGDAGAQPTALRIAYLTGFTGPHPATAWAAQLDGSKPVKLGTDASEAFLSPDGAQVALVTSNHGAGEALVLVPSDGGRARTLLAELDASEDEVAWSPDSKLIAVQLDGRRLLVVNAATGAKRVVARGSVLGVSFAPTSDRLVYARTAPDGLIGPVNLWVVNADGSHAHAITHDGRSLDPRWGPTQIVYGRDHAPNAVRQPTQLWLVRPDGSGRRQLTHLRAGVGNPHPLAWSDDGRRLLINYQAVDTQDVWAVDVPSGRVRDLSGRADSVIAMGLSHDGRTVLAQRGTDEDHPTIETIPWGGGHAHVLVRDAGSPSWNR